MKFIWQLKKTMVHKTTFAFFDRTTRGPPPQEPKTYNFHPILMKFIWQLKTMVHKTTFAFFNRITNYSNYTTALSNYIYIIMKFNFYYGTSYVTICFILWNFILCKPNFAESLIFLQCFYKFHFFPIEI